MRISPAKLRSEYKVRQWADIISNHPYVAVLQLTASVNWGRSNMKWRVLGEHAQNAPLVDARFAVPRAAREGATRTKFVGMSHLFRSAPCAVVYGTDVGQVSSVVRRAQDQIRDAVLVGGRFGEDLIHARQWRQVLEANEREQFCELLGVLQSGTSLVRTIESPARGLATALNVAGGATKLATLLTKHEESMAQTQ